MNRIIKRMQKIASNESVLDMVKNMSQYDKKVIINNILNKAKSYAEDKLNVENMEDYDDEGHKTYNHFSTDSLIEDFFAYDLFETKNEIIELIQDYVNATDEQLNSISDDDASAISEIIMQWSLKEVENVMDDAIEEFEDPSNGITDKNFNNYPYGPGMSRKDFV